MDSGATIGGYGRNMTLPSLVDHSHKRVGGLQPSVDSGAAIGGHSQNVTQPCLADHSHKRDEEYLQIVDHNPEGDPTHARYDS